VHSAIHGISRTNFKRAVHRFLCLRRRVTKQFICHHFRLSSLAETGPFVCQCLNNPTMPRFHTPAYRTGQADFPHLALGKDAHRITRHVTPSATSEQSIGVVGLIVNPHVLCCFLRWSLTEVPSLHRSYPASQVLRTSPPPHTAWSISHELPVDPDCDHRWGFPCCLWSPTPGCHRHYPGRSDGTYSLGRFPSTSAFPNYTVGRLLH